MTAETLYLMYTGLDTGVCLLDESARIIAVNPRTTTLLGRAEQEFLGADTHDLLHRQADGSRMARGQCPLLRALLRGRTAAQSDGTWFARGDGSVLPVGWLVAPYFTTGGRMGGAVLGFFAPDGGEAPPTETARRQSKHLAALEELTDRLALVAESTSVLTSTLDTDEALRRLVQLVVPRLAEWAVIDLYDDLGNLRRAVVVHQEEHARAAVHELEGPLPPVSPTSNMPLSRVLRGGAARLLGPDDYSGPPDSPIASVQRRLFDVTGVHSAIVAPLPGSQGVLGALTVARDERSAGFDTTELTLVDDIARRAGLAVDNARLYHRQWHIAETMQRYLLPPLPSVRGLEMAAQYRPAPHGAQVGGDWYDAFLLPDGSTSLAIGDVIGHDLPAAAAMSQVRNMLRAFAWDAWKQAPSAVIERLDGALVHISDAPLCTLTLARIEQPTAGTWQLRWSNAGHPPPLLVEATGRVRVLEGTGDVLLGTEYWMERHDHGVPLPALSTLVLYTDGLVESPQLPVDEGVRQLARNAAQLAGLPVKAFCEQLVRASSPAGHDDDIAVLVVRVPADSPPATPAG